MGPLVADEESWLHNTWRPMMGWLYMATCAFDFIVAPILWAIVQALFKQPITPWQPLTLQGAGLYHLAMGAIVGITSWSRTQEKLSSLNVSSPFNSMNNPMNNSMNIPIVQQNDATITTDTVTPQPATTTPVVSTPASTTPVAIPQPHLRHPQ